MFKKTELNYDYSALEPIISTDSLEDHYKNHAYYESELFNSLKGIKLPENIKSIEDLVKNYLKLPKELHIPVRQYGGGLINHNFFFKILKKGEKLTNQNLINEINKTFGSFDEFKTKFIEKATNIFGSGWTWLVIDKYNNLRIYNTYNQDNPWFLDMNPLIGIDVWEHAYFEKYNDNRKQYIEKLLNIINWTEVEKIYSEIKKQG